MKKLLILSILFFIGCSQGYSQNIRIAAAANLRYVLDTIKTLYSKQHHGVTIDITYGSSGTLAQQIIHGAQYHIFLSADKIFPEKVFAENMTLGEVKTYAYGKLVLWSNSIDLSQGIQFLKTNSIKKISIAKPEIAPYGERAIQSLRYYNMYDAVKDKIVYADNISQAAQFAASGNAEVGFIALSLIYAPEMKKGNYYTVDPKSYSPIEQACVLLKPAATNTAAQSFFTAILSKEYKPLFEAYGYRFPEEQNK